MSDALATPEDDQVVEQRLNEQALALWQKLGLEPTEVTTEELEQRITITHNALTHEITWHVEKMDGIQAEGVMVRALFSMYQEFFKARPRPRLTSGQAKAAVQLDGDRLVVGVEPLHEPTVVAGLLGAALCEVVERIVEDDPLKVWAALFEVEVLG